MYGRPRPLVPPLAGELNYQKVLFLPGRRLQPRELQLLQALPMGGIGKTLSSLYGFAAPLSGLDITIAAGWIRISPGTFGAYVPPLGWMALDCPGYAYPVPTGISRYWICLTPADISYRATSEDPSLGGAPLATRGGYGCHLSLRVSLDEMDGYPLAYVEGDTLSLPPRRAESLLYDWRAEMELRTFHEIGDCILRGLYVQEVSGSLLISPGRALIRGKVVDIPTLQLRRVLGQDLYLSSSGELFFSSSPSAPYLSTYRIHAGGTPLTIEGHPLYLYELEKTPNERHPASAQYSLLLAQKVDGIWLTPYRLPSLSLLYEEIMAFLLEGEEESMEYLGVDIYHPLYNAHRGSNYWTLPHSITRISLSERVYPHTRVLHAWQDRITETNLVPQSLEPWVRTEGDLLSAYNLLPGSYPPLLSGNPLPYTTKVGTGTSPTNGRLSYQLSLLEGVSIGEYAPSLTAPLDRGIGQSFAAPPRPIAISRVSFWSATSFTGVVSISHSSGGLPSGLALISVPLKTPTTPGWVDVDLPYPLYMSGAFCVTLSTADPAARVGVYNPVLPTLLTLDPNPTEGGGSSHLILSTSGRSQWTDIRYRDMCWRIYKAVLTEESVSITIPLTESGAYDGMDIHLPSYSPPGTALLYQWWRNGLLLNDLNSMAGDGSLSLSLSMDGREGIAPSFLGGYVDLWQTALSGTWISLTREEDYIYKGVLVRVYASLPEGTSLSPYFSSNGGRTWSALSPSLAPYSGGSSTLSNVLFYEAEDLSPAAPHYTVEGVEYMAYRTTIKIRVDLRATYPHVRPLLYGVQVYTS